MSEVCPNARKIYVGRDQKTHAAIYKHKCDVTCAICRGNAHVQDCPDCDGCGLGKGGVKCQTCGCYGKVPEALVA